MQQPRNRAARGKFPADQPQEQSMSSTNIGNIGRDRNLEENQMAVLLPLTTKDEKRTAGGNGIRLHAAFYVAYVSARYNKVVESPRLDD